MEDLYIFTIENMEILKKFGSIIYIEKILFVEFKFQLLLVNRLCRALIFWNEMIILAR